MKAVKKLLILAMTCVLFSAQGIAISEGSQTAPPLRHILDITLSAAPSQLVEPGEVILTFEIRNDSQYSADNVYFTPSGSERHERLGQLPAGDAQVFTAAYEVSPEELEAGKLKFVVSHDGIAGDGDMVEYEVSADVEMVEAKADIEFTCRISSAYASPGSAVTITYCVRNTGNVPLKKVRIKDELGDFAANVDELPCGGEKVFTSRVIAEDDMVSRAKVEYKAPAIDDERRECELGDTEIFVVQPELTAALELDGSSVEYGGTASGVITITALGTDFTDVYVKDDVTGEIIADSCEIPAGESISIAYSRPVRMPTDCRVMVSGLSATGDRFDTVSNTESVSLTGEFSVSELTVSASAATPVINRPGRVRITVAIENSGNAAARNVTLRETGLGELRRFAFVPPGEPTYREVLVDVSEDSVFEFCVCTEDENGVQQTVHAVEVPVTIAPDGEAPEEAEGEGENSIVAWIKRNISSRDTYVRMLAVAAAVLGILVIVLVVSHGREYTRRRQRKARINRRKKGEGERRARTK